MQHKNVNLTISFTEFIKLVQYTQALPEDADPELQYLRNILWQKLDKMVEHDLYTQYKTACSAEQREKARQDYLDKKCIPEPFRY